MTSIIWDNKINPSIEVMKIQRQTISVCMNTILDDLADFSQKCDHINELLDQLALLCQIHFKYEEQLLEELNYPPTSKQKSLHDLFLKDIEQLKSDNDQSHSPAIVNNFIKLRLDFIRNMNNETMMLCDFMKVKSGDKTTTSQ
jgi:hemerythrin-like metal-binding protein